MGGRVPRWNRLAIWSTTTPSFAKKWGLQCSLLPRDLSHYLTCIFPDYGICLLCSLHSADFTSWEQNFRVRYWRTTVLLSLDSTTYRTNLQRWYFVTLMSFSITGLWFLFWCLVCAQQNWFPDGTLNDFDMAGNRYRRAVVLYLFVM